MATAGDVMDFARVLLNDQAASLFTNTALLPVLKISYRELQQKMNLNGLSVDKEQSASIVIPSGTTSIVFGAMAPAPALPADLLYPIELKEKITGQPDNTYVLMNRTPFVPDLPQVSRLVYWTWIQEEIRLVGANTDVPIYIRYYMDLATLTDNTTEIPILDSDIYLAYRTAAIAASTIGGMPSKGAILDNQAALALDDFLGIGVSNRQAMPVRRRPFRSFGRRSFWNW
jgi:hypothetical protein